MDTLLRTLFFSSLLGYLFGVLLQSRTLRQGIESLWLGVTMHVEIDRTSRILKIADQVLDTVYRRNGRLSKTKLFTLVLMLNGLFVLGLAVGMDDAFDLDKLPGYGTEVKSIGVTIFFAVFAITALLWEVLSYLITSWFIAKANQANRITYLFLDIVTLVLALYILPVILAFMGAPLLGPEIVAIVVFTPPGPLLIGSQFSGIPLWLTAPAGLSICLPTLLVGITLLILYNRYTLFALEAIVSKLANSTAPQTLRNASLGVFGIASGLMSYYGVAAGP